MKEPFDLERDLEAFNDQIRILVEDYRIREARALIAATPGATETLWGKALALPVVTTSPGTGRGDFHANCDWLEAHQKELAGQWVAMWNGRMIARAPTYEELHTYLAESGLHSKRPLVSHVRK